MAATQWVARAARRIALALAMSLTLAACGGGGDEGDAPTPLPTALSVTAPASVQALGSTTTFSSNATAQALTFRWEFGDGTSSALANPDHVYSRSGDYTVRLTVTNEAGTSVSATSVITVADIAIVQGKGCSGANNTGWCWQRPLPQGNAINDYTFVDDTHGWAVGAAGTVLATADGGVTWQAQRSGTGLDLTKVVFTNPSTGWIASSYGELLKTSDAGATWVAVSFGRSVSVRKLGAKDANTAWVTTEYGTVRVTTNGGAAWNEISIPDAYSTLIVADSSTIWAVPYYYDNQALSRSIDSGTTWSVVTLPPIEPGLSRSFTQLQPSGASNALLETYESGYVVGTQTYVSRRLVWKSADGGLSWQLFTLPITGYYSLQLVDANTAYIFQNYSGPLQRTTDAGATWEPVPLPSITDSYAIQFQALSEQRLIVRDQAGRTYLTTDGGAHWAIRGASGSAQTGLNSVWFFDSREGLAIGNDGSGVRTSDGGQTWITTVPNSYYGWRRTQFLADGSAGWIISDTGSIYRSSDKGKTWLSPVPQTSALLTGVTDFHFVDEQHGWAVAPYQYSSEDMIFRSVDGGSSWHAVAGTYTRGLVSLRFADALHGVAVGPAGFVMLTSDGGATWGPIPTGLDRELRRITFVDAMTAIAVGDGGHIIRSNDKGQSWDRVTSPTSSSLNDVRFVSASTGYAVGDSGTLLVTRDAGLTWNLQQTGTQSPLQAVFFVDEQTGWIVGENGTILATATGGR
jgi:photosystem II stability/assembly factor-like uncharacterized protein